MQPTAHQNISEYLQTSLSGKKTDVLGSKLQSTVKRAMLTKIEFEPAPSDHGNHLQSLKRKYIVLEDCVSEGSLENDDDNKHRSQSLSASASFRDKQYSPSKRPTTTTTTTACSRPQPKHCLFTKRQMLVGWGADGSGDGGQRYATGSGLVNLGNTCYLNSSLQALFHVPALVRHLLESKWHQHVGSSSPGSPMTPPQLPPGSPADQCVYCAVVRVLRRTQQPQCGPIKPLCVYSKLRQISRELCRGRQEDAHEFVRRLLETMMRCDLAAKSLQRLDSLSKETAPLAQLFGGYLRNQVTCLRCHHPSITYQHFQDIPVDIKQSNTLYEGLVHYFGREKLGGCDYLCDRCKIRVPATKKFNIEEAPLVLCIQLKRFGMNGGKLNKHVSFPSSLDVGRFMTSSSAAARSSADQPPSTSQVLYSLVSLVNHMGSSAGFGHYTAAARAANGQVYTFDDSSVRPSSLQSMLTTSAYLLFYEMTAKTKHRLYGRSGSDLVDESGEVSGRRSSSAANVSATLSNTTVNSIQPAHKSNGLSDLTNRQSPSPCVQRQPKPTHSKLVQSKSLSSGNLSAPSPSSPSVSRDVGGTNSAVNTSSGRASLSQRSSSVDNASLTNHSQKTKWTPLKVSINQNVGGVKSNTGVANQTVGVAKQSVGVNKLGVVRSCDSPTIVVKRPLFGSMVLGSSSARQPLKATTPIVGPTRSLVPYDGSDDDKDDDEDGGRDNNTSNDSVFLSNAQAKSQGVLKQPDSSTTLSKRPHSDMSLLSADTPTNKTDSVFPRSESDGAKSSCVKASRAAQSTDGAGWRVSPVEDEGVAVVLPQEPLSGGDCCSSSTASSSSCSGSSASTDSWRVLESAKSASQHLRSRKRKRSRFVHDANSDQPSNLTNSSSPDIRQSVCRGGGDGEGGNSASGIEKLNRQPVLSWMQRSWHHLTGQSHLTKSTGSLQTDSKSPADGINDNHKHAHTENNSKTNTIRSDCLPERKPIVNETPPTDKCDTKGCDPSKRKRAWKLAKLSFGVRSNSPLAKRPRADDDRAISRNNSNSKETLPDQSSVSVVDSVASIDLPGEQPSSGIRQSESTPFSSLPPPSSLSNTSSAAENSTKTSQSLTTDNASAENIVENSHSRVTGIASTEYAVVTSRPRVTGTVSTAGRYSPDRSNGTDSGVFSTLSSRGRLSRTLSDRSELDSLLSNSGGPNTLGNNVLTWTGQPSAVSAPGSDWAQDNGGVQSELDRYNEELDIGKVKKCRGSRLQSVPATSSGGNPFQVLQERKNQRQSNRIPEEHRVSGRIHEEPRVPDRSYEERRVPDRNHEERRVPDRSHEKPRVSDRSHEKPRAPGRSHEERRVPGRSHEERRVPGTSSGILDGGSANCTEERVCTTTTGESANKAATLSDTSPSISKKIRKKFRHHKQRQQEEDSGKQKKLDFWLQRS